MKALNTAQKWLIRIMFVFCVLVFAVMILLVGLQVVMRFIAHNAVDMSWTEELVRVLLCWMTFFGTVLVYEEHGHVWVANLVDAVPTAARKLMLLLSYLIQIVFLVAVLLGATEYLPTVATQTTPVMHIPLPLTYVVIPITAAVTLLFCVRDMILMLQGKGDLKNG